MSVVALLTVQLLFADRDEDATLLDFIVLDGAHVPSRPPLGSPLSFRLAMPDGASPALRAETNELVDWWADHLAVVELSLVQAGDRTLVRLDSGASVVVLQGPDRVTRNG